MVLKLDLDMVNMYHHTKDKVSMSRHSKVVAQYGQTHTDTQRQKRKHNLPAYAGGKYFFSMAVDGR